MHEACACCDVTRQFYGEKPPRNQIAAVLTGQGPKLVNVSQLLHKLLFIVLIGMLEMSFSHAATRLVITGAPEELEENIRLSVGSPPADDDERALRRYTRALPEQAAIALGALGYFAADVDIKTRKAGNDTEVLVEVTPNDPVRVNVLDISILGSANKDGQFMPVLGSIPLRKNAVFLSDEYEQTKSILIDKAQDLGYFDFKLVENAVRVSREQLTADITLVVDSGDRYTFGDIDFSQETFSDEFLKRWVPFEQSDPYSSGLVGELTQNLQNSGYFSSVRVTPEFDKRSVKAVPLTVELSRKDDNQVALGIGYSTDTLFRTRLSWERPIFNRHGHSAEAELGLSEIRQTFSVGYQIPRKNQPLYNYWGIDYGLKNEIFEQDNESFLSTLNFQRVSRTASQWIEALFIRWDRETTTTSGEKERIDLVLPGISYSRTRTKGAPFVTWGQATSFELKGGSERVLSDINFLKLIGSYKYLRELIEKHTVIASFQYGAFTSNKLEDVPVTQRFFAGGDNSIRGFPFREVSPRNTEEVAIGGRYLEVVNLEYNYRFRDHWSGAFFVDGGRAFNNFDTGYSVGSGFGIRWQSPVGPFRVDIATPISDNDTGPVRVHLSLGAEL